MFWFVNYLIDTAAISELKRPRPNINVVRWFDSIAPSSLFLSVLTIGELMKGILRLPKSKKQRELLDWLESEIPRYFNSERILPISYQVSLRWGAITAQLQLSGFNPPIVDSLIAATCIEHNLICVTMNVRDIKRCGAQVFNPADTSQ